MFRPTDGELNFEQVRAASAAIFNYPDSQFTTGWHYRFQRYSGNLFPTLPKITDIGQMSIGDCYLLAVVQAIVLRRPNYFCQLMNYVRDQSGDDRVYVKLFYRETQAVLTPCLFRIEKTRLYEGLVFKTHETAWVNMLEKAYVGLRKSRGAPAGSRDAAALLSNSFENILKSGRPKDAFEAILGTEAEEIMIASERWLNRDKVPEALSRIYNDLFYLWDPRADRAPEFFDKREIALKNIFSGSLSQQEDFKHHSDLATNQSILALFGVGISPNFAYCKILRRDELVEKINTYPRIAEDTRTTLRNYVIQHCPEKRGISYVPNQDYYYEKIFQALSQGNMVCLSTDSKELFWGVGQQGKQVKGLAPNHAYVVINCYQRNGRKYVLLRNPWWERYVRGYIIKLRGQLSADWFWLRSAPIIDRRAPYQEIATSYLDPALVLPAIGGRGVAVTEATQAELDWFHHMHNVFALEISDVTKRCNAMSVGKFPARETDL